MLYLFFLYVLVLDVFDKVSSYNLISLGNANIPTNFETVEIDQLTYYKLSKNDLGNVSLIYELEGFNLQSETVTLRINGNEQKSIKVIKSTDTVSTHEKIYITKESKSNASIYTVKFTKFDYILTGAYTLEIKIGNNILSNTSYIYSVPVVNKIVKPKLGLEGDPMRITCTYDAYPNATEIQWKLLLNTEFPDKPGNLSEKNSTVIIQNDRIQFISGKDSQKKNDTLFINKLLKTDSGLYMCVIVSPRGKDFGIIKINVKDRWAALYPFIGIVIEVILLVTAILAYEKYQIRSQNKKNYGENVDEDNKDPDMLLTNRAGDDENIVTENEIQQNDIDADKFRTNNVDMLKQREAAATTKNV